MLDLGLVVAGRHVEVAIVGLVVAGLAPPDLVRGRQAAVEAALPDEGDAVVGDVDGLEVRRFVGRRSAVEIDGLGRVALAVVGLALVAAVVGGADPLDR